MSSPKSCLKKQGQQLHAVEGGWSNAEVLDASDLGEEEGVKELMFGQVEVFEFKVCLGDHPDVSAGCPVSIDWKLKRKTLMDIDHFEYKRSEKRRPIKELKISVTDRAQM